MSPRKRMALTVAAVIALAVWQAIQQQREQAERMRETAELRALLEWVVVRPDSR